MRRYGLPVLAFPHRRHGNYSRNAFIFQNKSVLLIESGVTILRGLSNPKDLHRAI